MHRRSKRKVRLLAGVGVLLGVGMQLFEAPGPEEGPLVVAGDLLVGWAWIAAGLIAITRRTGNRSGLLMILVGYTWFIHGLHGAEETPLLYTVPLLLDGLHLWIAAHLVLAFPGGRLAPGLDRGLVTAIYLIGGVLALAGALVSHPRRFGCEGCDASANGLLVAESARAAGVVGGVQVLVTVVLAGSVLFVLVGRWRRATQPARRVLAPVLLAGCAGSVAAVLAGVLPPLVYEDPPLAGGAMGHLFRDVGLAVVPLGFLVGLLRTRVTRTVIGDLLVALSEAPPPARLRDELARALGDPSLELLLWRSERVGYVDAEGRVVTPLADSATRAVTELKSGDERLGLLVHDPALLDDDGLIEAVGAAGRLALVGARAQTAFWAELHETRGRPEGLEELTSREREVLALVAQGRSNRAISDELFLSTRTVESHVRTIFRKLDLADTEQDHRRVLAALAFRGPEAAEGAVNGARGAGEPDHRSRLDGV